MIDNQETQGKIAAEVRDLSKCIKHKMEMGDYISVPMPTVYGKPLDVYYAELADRIDAAAKRMEVMHNRETEHYKQERNEAPAKERKRLQDNGFLIIHKKDYAVNAVKLREALLRCEAISHLPEVRDHQCVKDMRSIIKSALAAPARNCDMGTTEEQGARLRRFCLRQKWCDRCPLRQRSITTQVDCKLLWAQLPYDESRVCQ